MSPQQYRQLLEAALPTVADAETAPVTTRTLFTPRTHRDALNPATTVVRGSRGVGKSVWFDALLDAEKRTVAATAYAMPVLDRLDVSPGYGIQSLPDVFPGQRTLADLVDSGTDPETLWWSVIANSLAPGRVGGATWRERVAWVHQNGEAVDAIVAEADRAAQNAGRTRLFVFDGLERLHPDRRRNDDLLRGILRLALDLRTRTSALRAKIFARPDILDRVFDFPDASKLNANSADLTWPSMVLYGLVFHLLGNAEHDLARTFREHNPGDAEWGTASGVFVVPDVLRTEQDRQRAVLAAFAGEFMGSDRRRGTTYTWLPNHLADGAGQVSPRSFLIALRHAARVSADDYPGHRTALHWEAIKQGVQKASEQRVGEVTEDIPWVATLVRPLAGRQVPMPEAAVHEAWSDAVLRQVANGPEHPQPDGTGPTGPASTDRPGLVEELMRIGVMTRRADGRVDLPDVYRVAFGLGRKGGVKRATA